MNASCECKFRGGGCTNRNRGGLFSLCEPCSNGIHRSHAKLDYSFAPVAWGVFAPGRDYSFFNGARQLVHGTFRGTTVDPVDLEPLLVFTEDGVTTRYSPSAVHRPVELIDAPAGAGDDVEAFRG